MKQTLLWLITLLFLSGCFNDRGISMRYYSNCEEYYDAQGYYHKKCDENLLDYSDAKKALTPASSNTEPKVW